MRKITPHLWFDNQAKEAADFYTSIFPNSKTKSLVTLHDTPSGKVDIVKIELAGQEFILLSGGPLFKFTPAISFLVACKTKEEADQFWEKLALDGKILMELALYPFSERYGWLEDKYGLSWQIMYMGDMPMTQKITPTLMFVGDVCGRAEEAINFYTSIFDNAEIKHVMRYAKGESMDKEGTIKHAGFTLEGQDFAAMDSSYEHKFNFNEAISFIVHCDNQEEVDYFWQKLSAVPAAEQCGWIKDRYGVSWQIAPKVLAEMMESADAEQLKRLTQALLKMKKLDIEPLKSAFNNKNI